MAPLEESPRPTKRRKVASSTTPESTSSPAPIPFSTRAFRAVKEVVLGKGIQPSNVAIREDETLASSATNGAIGGLRKSLSALEIWKMARLQNGSTRGMGISGTSSPSRSVTGASTPTKRKRKKSVPEGGNDDGNEGTGTPSSRAATADGPASTGRRRNYDSEIYDGINDEGDENEEDPDRAVSALPSNKSHTISPTASAQESTEDRQSATKERTPRSKRRKPSHTLARRNDQYYGGDATPTNTVAKRHARSNLSEAQQRKSPDQEESELGFRAIRHLNRAPNRAQENAALDVDGHEGQPSASTGSISTPRKKRGRPPRTAIDANLGNQSPAVPLDERLDGEVSSISFEDAGDALRKALERISHDEMVAFRTKILSGLTGKRRLPLVNLDSEYRKVHQLVEQTVLAGEGNSMILIGSRGSAKTALVETVISDISSDHGENFHVVRLNGFIHTDDKLALREIWRQLGREMEVEDDAITGRSNYADTLTSLLALLSHTAEEEPDAENPSVAKSVIFILDEFDLFASHPRQTLLYNLFDVAQSRNAPIAVLGLTTKIDVVESLEKRVKSRFGQRYVHLSMPRTLAAFTSICKAALIPPMPDLRQMTTDGDDQRISKSSTIQELHSAWTAYLDSLFSQPAFLTQLRSIYATSKSIPTFFSSCFYPISTLSPSNLPTLQTLLAPSTSLRPPDSKLHLLASLSELALSLLIAATRLDIILSTDLCNFDMAYEEYVTLASRVKMQTSASGQLAVGGGGGRVWGRAVAKGEWERLIALDLVLPATAGTGKGEQGRMWKVDVGLEEIGGSVKLGAVMARWCREI